MAVTAPRIPELPLLAPWYRLIEDGDRLVLEHAGRFVAFEGRAVGRLLPRLLPLLDGSRSVDEIVEILGRAVEPAVRKALDVLGAQGVLVEGPPLDCARELLDTVSYLAAAGDVAPAAVAARIADAGVAVVGGAAAAAEVARVLRRSGVPEVERRGWDDEPCARDIIVVSPDAAELERVEAWNEAALATSATWLPVLPFDGRFAAIGPLVVPGETACYACFGLRRAASLGIGTLSQAVASVPLRAGGGPTLAVAAAAVAAAHVLRWIALSDPSLPGTLYALEGDGGVRLSAHAVLRVPRCPACSGTARTSAALPWFQPATEEVA